MIPFERMIVIDGRKYQCLFITNQESNLPLFWVVDGNGYVTNHLYVSVRIPQFAPVATGHGEDDDQ